MIAPGMFESNVVDSVGDARCAIFTVIRENERMPVVQGAHRTKVQMLAYSIMLVPLTVLPWLSGTQGGLYAIAAVLLGFRLIWYCVRLLREPVATPLAWRMYRYSLVYLALLFVAMGADRMLPFGHIQQPVELVLVRNSDLHHSH